jgi:hypothetical protein
MRNQTVKPFRLVETNGIREMYADESMVKSSVYIGQISGINQQGVPQRDHSFEQQRHNEKPAGPSAQGEFFVLCKKHDLGRII